jgi:hypothetical protein
MPDKTLFLLGAVFLLVIVSIVFGGKCMEMFSNSNASVNNKLSTAVANLKELSDAGMPAIKFEHFGDAVSDEKIKKIMQAAGLIGSGQGKNIIDFEKIVGGEVSPIVFATVMQSYRAGKLTPDRVREILNTKGMQSKGLTGQM